MLEREGSIIGVFFRLVFCASRDRINFEIIVKSLHVTLSVSRIWHFLWKRFSMGVGIGGGSWTRNYVEFEWRPILPISRCTLSEWLSGIDRAIDDEVDRTTCLAIDCLWSLFCSRETSLLRLDFLKRDRRADTSDTLVDRVVFRGTVDISAQWYILASQYLPIEIISLY